MLNLDALSSLRRYGARTSGEPGFMGAAHEDAMGLIAIGARTLDPASGRWTAPDPLFEWMVETPAGEESAGAESRPGYAEFGGLRVASRGDALMLATGAHWREGALAGLQSHEALRRYELSLGSPATRADPSGLKDLTTWEKIKTTVQGVGLIVTTVITAPLIALAAIPNLLAEGSRLAETPVEQVTVGQGAAVASQAGTNGIVRDLELGLRAITEPWK